MIARNNSVPFKTADFIVLYQAISKLVIFQKSRKTKPQKTSHVLVFPELARVAFCKCSVIISTFGTFLQVFSEQLCKDMCCILTKSWNYVNSVSRF